MNRKQRQLLLVASACLGGMLLFVQQSPGVERFTEHARQAGEAGRSFAFADPFKALTRQVWRRMRATHARRRSLTCAPRRRSGTFLP